MQRGVLGRFWRGPERRHEIVFKASANQGYCVFREVAFPDGRSLRERLLRYALTYPPAKTRPMDGDEHGKPVTLRSTLEGTPQAVPL